MPGRKDLFQNAMNRGHSSAWDQDWERATMYYQQALNEFPENPQALNSLALAYYQTQQLDIALDYYLKAAEIAPNDPVPREKASEIYEHLGSIGPASENAFMAAELYARSRDLEKAIACWRKTTQLTPESLPAHSRLALVYDRTGNKRSAVSEYIAVASLLQNAGQKDKALETMHRAQMLMPDNPQITQVVAMLKSDRLMPKPSRQKGETGPISLPSTSLQSELETPVSQSIELDPLAEARQKALTDLAGLLFETAEIPQVETQNRKGFQAIVEGVAGTQSSQQYDWERIFFQISQVVDLQTRGADEEAAKELEKAIGLGLDHPSAYFDLGFLQAEEGRLESAVRNLRKAASDPEYALGANLMMGKIHRQLGKLQDASTDYLQALKIADSLVISADQAEILRQLYDPLIESQRNYTNEEANQRLCENVEELLLAPGWKNRLAQAREELPDQQSNGTPMPLAEILTASTSSEIVEALANINQYVKQGRWRSALDEAYFAIEHAPTYLPLHIYVAEMLIHLGFTQEAVNKLAVVARTYEVRGEPEQGIKTIRRLVELAPTDITARLRLIETLNSTKDYPSAIEEYIQLGAMYYNRADLVQARQTYNEALELTRRTSPDPDLRIKILYLIADIDLQSLDWREALRIFEQIRELKPDDEKARNNIINLHLRLAQHHLALEELDNYLGYLIEKHQVGQAFSFLETLASEQPDVLPIRFRLAELYRQAGKKEMAVSQYDLILEKLFVSGDNSGAVKILNIILRMNPPNADEYKEVLDQLQNQSK